MSWRPNTTNLRLLLLGAIGGAVWACAGDTRDCVAGDPACSDGSAGAGGGEPGACTNPKPILADGPDVGIYQCEERYMHRKGAKTCPSVWPRPGTVEWPEAGLGGQGGEGGQSDGDQGGAPAYTTSTDECSSDADCPENSFCKVYQTNFVSGYVCGPPGWVEPPMVVPDYARVCQAGCVEDSDCGANAVCVCGPEIGACYSISGIAGCHDDSDCDPAFLCLDNGNRPLESFPFTRTGFACQLPGDECNSDADCLSGGNACLISRDGRTCESIPVCGRPFLIADEARKAAPVASPDWLTSAAEIRLADLQVPTDPSLRAQLAAHWTEIGLLEHASVAAFARFTLQLLSLGAPAELVEQSQRAALDEVRHAELAFALASRYAGRSIGPGPLPLTGALDGSSVEAILRTTVREGCVGETRAALEASRAAEPCEDPVVRSVLETIAADEARHAELAWKVVRFIVSAHPEMASVLAEEFGSLARQEKGLVSVDGTTSESSRFGVLTPGALERCHREAYRDVIAPCARTLLAMATSMAA